MAVNTTNKTYTHNDVTVNIVRALSNNETKIMDKSIDAILKLHDGQDSIIKYEANIALKLVLCSENLWWQMAKATMLELNKTSDRMKRAELHYRLEAMIIAMTHVFEVKYGVRRGELIAARIDPSHVTLNRKSCLVTLDMITHCISFRKSTHELAGNEIIMI